MRFAIVVTLFVAGAAAPAMAADGTRRGPGRLRTCRRDAHGLQYDADDRWAG
jgi:hypothetical protein